MGLSFPWDETCQWGLVFWGKRWGKLQIQWSRIILFRLVLFSRMLISGSDGKKSSNHVFFMGKIMLKHPCGSNELNLFFFRSPTCQICWRRASATAVVAVVFLADRLNKHMIHSPGRWTCAGCNALAALLCDMVFQYDDSVGSCWNIWNVYTVCIYIYVYAHFFPRNKQW